MFLYKGRTFQTSADKGNSLGYILQILGRKAPSLHYALSQLLSQSNHISITV